MSDIPSARLRRLTLSRRPVPSVNPLRVSVELLAVVVAIAAVTTIHPSISQLVVALYFAPLAALMTVTAVTIDRGQLNLNAIPSIAAATLVEPAYCLIVGAAAGLVSMKGRPVSFAAPILWTALGSMVSSALRTAGQDITSPWLAATAMFTALNWIVIGLAISSVSREPVLQIWRRNFSRPWFAAFGYFALAGYLLATLVDGTWNGFTKGLIVCLLAVALTDTIAGRRIRLALRQELDDALKHLALSRALEGVVHNLRNHLSVADGHLSETTTLSRSNSRHVHLAAAAIRDALRDVTSLGAGAAPAVQFHPNVDLNAIARRARDDIATVGNRKKVSVDMVPSVSVLRVRADPLLLREAITNLAQNAVEAAPSKGRVTITCGSRSDGFFIRISDNGPGISPENRRHLFEPHFTTKEHGTGMGLFVSYGIVREHQGRLLYEGDKRGAVFTVVLPPAPAATAPTHSSRQA